MRKVRSSWAAAALCFAALSSSGVLCIPTSIKQVTPGDGAVVTDFSFLVEVRLTVNADPATLDVELNGVPLALEGGGKLWTASVEPGPPLQDANLLSVTVGTRDGGTAQLSHSFAYLPPKARAFQVTDPASCVTGPMAHCRPGDFMLANDAARFVVQKGAQRDMWSVGQYGGNLIDAELVVDGVPQGNDNFLETQPSVNLETVINAQSVEIVNDGQDGSAAVVRSCGPDDLLDFVNPSTNIREFGFPLPPIFVAEDDRDHDVEGCTEYVLEPGVPFVRLETTIFNEEPQPLGLFVGDWVNAAGEVDPWSVTAPSALVSGGGIGEPLTGSLQGLEYVGFGDAERVNYSIVPVPFEGAVQESDFLTASGTTLLLQNASIVFSVLFGNPPTFVVPAQGSKSFTRYFGVSDGSDAGGVALEALVRNRSAGTLEGCVTLGGVPADGARVAVLQTSGSTLVDLVAHFVTRPDGCYGGRVPAGSYVVMGAREGTPYEGGGTTPLAHPVVIAADGVVVQDIALLATGRLRVAVLDEGLAPLPARVSVVGFDPSPELSITSTGTQAMLLGPATTGVFAARGKDDLPFGLVRAVYAGADGVAEFELEPGDYQIFVSRGFEYSLFDELVQITAGALAQVDAQITRVLDTSGFVSSDFHVHGLQSADSAIRDERRVLQFAGEGVDNIVLTEHNARADLNPMIQALALGDFVHATVGEEITTWDYGHFNGYPYVVDPTRLSGGSLDWGIQAPPGQAFPSYGNYTLTPAGLDAKGTTGPGTTAESVVQINHISSTFGPLRIDTSQVPPQSALSPAELLAKRFDPAAGNLFHHFRAMELVNGAGQGAFNGFLGSHLGIWFNHLNQGLHVTGTGVSDTHGFHDLSAGGARTWTASPTDAPASLDPQHVGASIKAGRASLGMGAFLRVRLVAEDASGNEASLAWGGQTLVTSTNGSLRLEIELEAPAWAPYDRIEIYANAPTHVTGSVEGVPVYFGSTPTRVLTAGTDFAVTPVTVNPGVPGAERLETSHAESFSGLAEDTWFVVIASGTNGISRPMFPVAPHDLSRGSNATLAALLDGNLGEGGTRAWAISNPLYADVDGVPGFQAPLAP